MLEGGASSFVTDMFNLIRRLLLQTPATTNVNGAHSELKNGLAGWGDRSTAGRSPVSGSRELKGEPDRIGAAHA